MLAQHTQLLSFIFILPDKKAQLVGVRPMQKKHFDIRSSNIDY